MEKCYAEQAKRQEPPKKLKANWKMLPPDCVNIILDILDKYNFEFYVNRYLRVDKLPHSLATLINRPQTVAIENKLQRLPYTPPISWNKYIDPGVCLHLTTLTHNLKTIFQELQKRKHISVDSNIKPSKMRFKYIKNSQAKTTKQYNQRDVRLYLDLINFEYRVDSRLCMPALISCGLPEAYIDFVLRHPN